MIIGVVTTDREAVIRLTIRGSGGRRLRIEAVIDTGFDGWLSLPRPVIAALRLPWKRRGRAILADGSETVFDIYEATALWHQKARRITVDDAPTALLVGMALLMGSELNIKVRSGGKVTIKPMLR